MGSLSSSVKPFTASNSMNHFSFSPTPTNENTQAHYSQQQRTIKISNGLDGDEGGGRIRFPLIMIPHRSHNPRPLMIVSTSGHQHYNVDVGTRTHAHCPGSPAKSTILTDNTWKASSSMPLVEETWMN
uniref:Uncharacterized protein n=1 Tax=Compsopogon caeruleus TaxID=31354 RepID=A0A6T6BIY0_9RHOD|mmetsp:Transcript_15861/g.31833  ORF Transcript_15861/g.31833 Transcript_15861/m.31833 type:complete len:128 (+) Transcript_15861:236-619(+)